MSFIASYIIVHLHPKKKNNVKQKNKIKQAKAILDKILPTVLLEQQAIELRLYRIYFYTSLNSDKCVFHLK